MTPLTQAEARKRAGHVKLVALDNDGVLNPGFFQRAQIGEHIVELISFDVQDGMGIKHLQKLGITVAVITGRAPGNGGILTHRLEELGCDTQYLVQACKDKKAALEEMRTNLGLTWDQLCFVGDDTSDVDVLGDVGLPVVPANVDEVAWKLLESNETRVYKTTKPGGHGAVRELANLIAEEQGLFVYTRTTLE